MPTDAETPTFGAPRAPISTSDLDRNLQVIADGIRDVCGFGIMLVGAVRSEHEVECVFVHGGPERLQKIVGTYLSLEGAETYVENGVRYGDFALTEGPDKDLNPPWDAAPARQPTGPGLPWPGGQLMVARLTDPDGGHVIGYLVVDDPIDGTMPSSDQLSHLDTYAQHSARVLSRALSLDSMEQRFELIRRLRDVIHDATVEVGAFELIQEIAPKIMDILGSTDFAVQLYDGPGHPEVAPPIQRMDGSLGAPSPFFWRLAIDATYAAYERKWVSVVTAGRPELSFMSPEHHAGVVAHLASEGMTSGVQAPLIVGTEFVGSMFLGRSGDDWTEEQLAAAAEIGHDVGRAVINARARQHDQQAVQRLRELDTYKTHLITQISHEFRSPLTAIMGHLELAEDSGGQLMPTSMSAMRRGTQRLLKLTEQLMTLSAMAASEDGGETCDAIEVVREAAALYAEQAERLSIALTVSLPHEEVRIRSSAYELELLVVNLVDNAIKYTDPGGEVEVSVEICSDEIRVAVRDTGIGVAPADHQRVFDEFFRSDDNEAMSRPGTGLGLSIVARIVERLDGEIQVQSALGQGSTFAVLLPRPTEASGPTLLDG